MKRYSRVAISIVVSCCFLTTPALTSAQGRRSSPRSSVQTDPGFGAAEAGEVAGAALPSRGVASAPLVMLPSEPAPAQATAGLVINGTFDTSITSSPNAAAIEAAFNNAVAVYQSLYTDPITVNILFRYANTLPNGSAIPNGSLARSNWIFYTSPWLTYVNQLTADAKSANDTIALASIPSTAQTVNIAFGAPTGRAIGFATNGAMCADSSINSGSCTYDGIVTLVSTQPFSFTRPPAANTYDAQRSIEHEIDEVLGTGSGLDLNNPITRYRPLDLWSWSAPGTRNVTSTGSRYFSIDSGTTNIVGLNQNSNGDFGDWLSSTCPQSNPYAQNAFSCPNQYSDITAASPEGILLDTMGFDPVPTVTQATVSGRVLSIDGSGLRNARVSLNDQHGTTVSVLTNAFGYFTFQNVPTGLIYIATASAKTHTFTQQLVTVNNTIAGLNFTAAS